LTIFQKFIKKIHQRNVEPAKGPPLDRKFSAIDIKVGDKRDGPVSTTTGRGGTIGGTGGGGNKDALVLAIGFAKADPTMDEVAEYMRGRLREDILPTDERW
jgi:hypothetical protein